MATNELLRHFYGGFIRLHLLHHASEAPICGIEMMAELKRHGYRLSPGTLYPILHHLEKSGYLVCHAAVVTGKRRKNYTITAKGRKLLANAQDKLRELFTEIIQQPV